MITTRKRVEYAAGYIELRLLDEAAHELAQICAADQRTPDVLTLRLELAMAANAWTDILKLAPIAVELKPTAERPWIAWAYALRELHRVEEARDVLVRGELAIEDPTVLVDYNLACYACLLGDQPEARRRLARVFQRDPGWQRLARGDADLAELMKTWPDE